jgi:hypothetical protein
MATPLVPPFYCNSVGTVGFFYLKAGVRALTKRRSIMMRQIAIGPAVAGIASAF